MRVISGKARGLKLNPPKNNEIRPTTDRVKESMFNIINEDVYDSIVLDLFAGSGGLGIEALSRNAKECVFVDLKKDSIEVLRSNIKKARVENESKILNCSCFEAIKKLSGQKFDIIFMDPPYFENLFVQTLEEISSTNLLSENGMIVVEHDSKEKLDDEINNLEKYKSKKYGNTTLSFYELKSGE